MLGPQVVMCLGRHYSALTFAGSLGPYTPSGHMSAIPKVKYAPVNL